MVSVDVMHHVYLRKEDFTIKKEDNNSKEGFLFVLFFVNNLFLVVFDKTQRHPTSTMVSNCRHVYPLF